MESERQGQQVYFEQCEPQFQESNIVQEVQNGREEKMYNSFMGSRNAPKTASNQHRRTIQFQIKRSQVIFKPQKTQNTAKMHRKMTFSNTSSPNKNNSSNPVNKKIAICPNSFRTVYFNKKASCQFDSISPEPQKKYQRQSASPDRRSLYWLKYHPEIGDSKDGKQSNFGSKTLKVERDEMPNVTAASYIAMMSDTQQILAEKNIDQRRQIASLTKIMTAYTVVNLCNTYGIKIRQQKISIHQQASWMIGTTANLKLDEEFFIIDLLYGLLLPSGNDAGVALAQYFGKFLSFKLTKDEQGQQQDTLMERFQSYKEFYDSQYQKDSIRLFVFQMNKNSIKIGLKNTRFQNPTGLSNSKNYSTSRDMAQLTSHSLKNHLLRQIFRKKMYSCEATNEKLSSRREVQWKNTNRHLYQFKQCIGIKTGITPTAGPCLSSAYKVLNREVVVIVLNSLTIEDRYEDARSIYKWCRRNMRIY